MLLLGIASIAPVLGQTATVVRVEDTEIEVDESGAVPITLDGSPGIVAMHIEITYDPDFLSWESQEQGELLAAGALIEANVSEPGRVVIGFATLEAATGSGELILANFESTGEEGTTTLTLENVSAWDADGFDVLVETQNGEVTVESGFPTWLLLLILCLLAFFLLLIIVLVIWFLRRRSKRSTTEPVAPAATPQAQPGDQQPTGARFCSSCGEPLDPGAAFCSNCGTKVPVR